MTKYTREELIRLREILNNTEPEPAPEEEEEEEIYEDNSTNRAAQINGKPESYKEYIDKLDSLDIIKPDIPDINFNENDLYSVVGVITDSTKLLYNTRNFRLENYSNESKNLYNSYKFDYELLHMTIEEATQKIEEDYNSTVEIINNKPITEDYTEEMKQQELKTALEEHDRRIDMINNSNVKTINEEYINKSYEIAKRINNLKQQDGLETGFIGDVFIERNLNGIPVEEYLTTNKPHTHNITDVNDLQENLSNLNNSKSNNAHTHDIKLKLNLGGISHIHHIKDIVNLQDSLDNLQEEINNIKEILTNLTGE